MPYGQPQVPEVAVVPGQVLRLAPGSRKWFRDGLILRVTRVRMDLSRYYDGHLVWLEGEVLDHDGVPVRWTQELVRTAALPWPANSIPPSREPDVADAHHVPEPHRP